MKFGKKYQEYLEREALPLRLQGCSYVEFKRHKKLLKKCPHDALTFAHSCSLNSVDSASASTFAFHQTDSTDILTTKCHSPCTVCQLNFFPNLMVEISAVVDWFNSRAQQLLNSHLASGFRKYLLRLKKSVVTDRSALIQEGEALVNYASMNGIAIRKVLKKYDKVHSSEKGRAFRSRLQNMHAELLQSPWLVELAALYINLSDSNGNTALSLPVRFSGCKGDLDEEKPVISCTLLGSLKLELDLTCSICLDTVFDPVSLACGHIFCNSCACSSAYVLTIQGLKYADRAAKCPLCRQDGGYVTAVHLKEVHLLIKNRCKGYWEERLHNERTKRLQQVKEYWDKQVQAVAGF